MFNTSTNSSMIPVRFHNYPNARVVSAFQWLASIFSGSNRFNLLPGHQVLRDSSMGSPHTVLVYPEELNGFISFLRERGLWSFVRTVADLDREQYLLSQDLQESCFSDIPAPKEHPTLIVSAIAEAIIGLSSSGAEGDNLPYRDIDTDVAVTFSRHYWRENSFRDFNNIFSLLDSKFRIKGYKFKSILNDGVVAMTEDKRFSSVDSSPESMATTFVSRYLLNAEAIPMALRDKLAQAAREFLQIKRSLGNEVVSHRVVQFVNSLVGEGLADFKKEVIENEELYKSYSLMFGGTPDSYQMILSSKLDEFLTQFLGGPTAKDLDKLISSYLAAEAKVRTVGHLVAHASKDFGNNLIRELVSQLSEIASYPMVSGLHMESDALVVSFRDVVLEHDHYQYNLGPYDLYILSSSDPSGIKFRGHRFPSGGVQHPHIVGDRVCFGTLREGIYKLKASFDFRMLVTLAWRFLHTYNPNDKYADISSVVLAGNIVPVVLP